MYEYFFSFSVLFHVSWIRISSKHFSVIFILCYVIHGNRHLPGGIEKTMKIPSEDDLCPGRNSKITPPEYNSGALPLEPTHSMH
jgi:hypothetical protein